MPKLSLRRLLRLKPATADKKAMTQHMRELMAAHTNDSAQAKR
jgi:hypothetical protein